MSLVALDIGGTKIAAAKTTPDGQILARASAPTPAKSGGAAIIAAALELINQLCAHQPPTRIGVGTAGVVDRQGEAIIAATDAIGGWVGTNIAAALSAATGAQVRVENDVNAHLRGEMWRGAARGADSAIMAAIGTGIGGAIALGGEILIGKRGLGGDIGHLPIAPDLTSLACPCGARSAHLEAICSGPGMLAWYLERGGDAQVNSGKALVAKAADDPLAAAVIDTAASLLGASLGGIANVIDPQVVVIGGGVANAGSRWWEPLRNAFTAALMPALSGLPLVQATLGTDAALLGASKLALEG